MYINYVTDAHGKVRIWDTVNAEHILKNEFQPFAGNVKDLDWSGDSQRIVVGGQGREKYVAALVILYYRILIVLLVCGTKQYVIL